jgi:hypothetical protein
MTTRRNRYTTNQEPSTPSTVAADDDYDIFDGLDTGIDAIDYNIEDEIEIPPPPPPLPPTTTTTTGDVEARPLPPALLSRAPHNQHDTSSYDDTLDSNSTGNGNTNVTNGEEIELERVVSSFFCGVSSGGNSSGIGIGIGDYSTTTATTNKWWNRLGSMMKIKQYEELQDNLCLQDKEPDQDQAQPRKTPQPRIKVTTNIANVYGYSNGKDKVKANRKNNNNNNDNDKLEVVNNQSVVKGDDTFNIVAVASTAYDKDKDNISCATHSRDTVIQHSMRVDEYDDHDRGHDVEKNFVKVIKKGGDGDEKQQQPILSVWWETMSEKKLFGISYRLILLVCINLIAFIFLICLVARFKSNNKNSSDINSNLVDDAAGAAGDGSISNNGIFDTIDNTTTSTTTIDNNGDEEAYDNKENENDSELLSLCNEDGVTVDDDGVILTTNQAIESGEYYCSPSKMYMIGMLDGDLSIINVNTNETVWSAGVTDGIRTILRADGSLIIVNDNRVIIWRTESIPTNFNNGNSAFFNFNLDRQLVFWNNNEGIIAIQQVPATISNNEESNTPTTYWMDGSPNANNNNYENKKNLKFPVRGTFYFPTFDSTAESWEDINGRLPMHEPTLGWYSSSDPMVAKAHVEAMEYGKINLGIASWEGPDTNFDRSRMIMLLDETTEQNSEYLKWTFYHESERSSRSDEDEIRTDLEYLQKWFAWKESWAYIDNKPVIFVNNGDGCDVTERWNDASNDWYVVLRIFDGYEDCEYQPNSWHEQSVNDGNDGIDIKEGLYHNLAPGEWRSGRRQPDMERLSQGEWCEHVQDMIDSNEQWQMIVSFNEAAQGTSVEPSEDWRSDSGYGYYLDCLNDESMY